MPLRFGIGVNVAICGHCPNYVIPASLIVIPASLIVIPAEAGICSMKEIPAYAGMTKDGSGNFLFRKHKDIEIPAFPPKAGRREDDKLESVHGMLHYGNGISMDFS